MSAPARLLISCPDQPGIVAAVSGLLTQIGCNIIHADQHSTDPTGGRFFMRMVFEPMGVSRTVVAGAFEAVARRFDMQWTLSYGERRRMAVLVSKYDHCLIDLLWRRRRGDLEVDIPLIVSNHPDLEKDARFFGVPFYHLEINRENKRAQEDRMHEMFLEHGVDFVVLARYMQIVSPEMVARWPSRIINIHHSFLPAFIGAKPYHHAFERGVKIIGATAHYVTDNLDEGPIIEQDVVRVTHRHSVEDLVRLGRDIERQVLARAVAAHLEERVLVYGNKTVVF
ncbi:formyltetrahydrofolate deformylase [Deinobacterium chartae]|uniref:Formyltetrahydrofolate deformylase n=1 Tax=Deinobacterium chartae TaxID=521158 RepID=A0A841I0F5_9DEIO|nr:formyltetrahydrofolate deformylase [Deinobacterium chartae]MBB6097738.1 formyltetrahydrofolate deformylase [Deinobacterium chartae]